MRESEDLRIGHPTLFPTPRSLAHANYGKPTTAHPRHAISHTEPPRSQPSQATYSLAPAQPPCKTKKPPRLAMQCVTLGENCYVEACYTDALVSRTFPPSANYQRLNVISPWRQQLQQITSYNTKTLFCKP